MMYHVEYDIAAICVTLFITYYLIFKKGLGKHANRVYLVLVLISFIAEISDVFGSLANNHPEYTNTFTQDFWNYLYLSTHNLMAFAFVVYLFYLLGYEKKKALFLVTIPYSVDLVLLVLNPAFHLLFYYDEKRTYLHGPAFPVIYVVAALYMIFAIYLSIRHWKKLGRNKAAALIFFLIISFIPTIIQMIFPLYLMSLFFESLGLMGILFSIENKDDVINPTTGILNRYALQDDLDVAMKEINSTLLLIKIPNLHHYNKMIGFENMNVILEQISKWLEEESGDSRCYDCGRGHFAVLCEDVAKSKIEDFQKNTFERFARPWVKGKISMIFPVQFGVIRLPEDTKNVENLFALIDTVFDGKDSCVLDVPKFISEYERRVLIENLIEKALRNKSFQVYYQPIYDVKSGKVHSAEALCRLIDEEHGMIPPDEFIPIAEQNGAILEIGKFVFEEVCRFYREGEIKDQGIKYLEVNLSVIQCMSRSLRITFDEILKWYSMDAGCINLEITESAAADNREVLFETIEKLKNSGFTFSLDDYGTGYSNISYMYEMPFSIIKIDRSILWKAIHPSNGEGEKNALIYMENTIRMLQEMGYKVLMEGVETGKQKEYLESIGCDYLQGFYFSKPIPGDAFEEYLRKINR